MLGLLMIPPEDLSIRELVLPLFGYAVVVVVVVMVVMVVVVFARERFSLLPFALSTYSR